MRTLRPLFDKFTREELINLVLEQDAIISSKKFCGGCGKYLMLSDFGVRKESKDGLQGRCKACNNALSKAWRDRNPDYVKASRRADYELRKERRNDSK